MIPLGWIVKFLQFCVHVSSRFHFKDLKYCSTASSLLRDKCLAANMFWLVGWSMCLSPVHLLLEASVLPPLHNTQGQTYTLGDGSVAFKTAACVPMCACVFKCICVTVDIRKELKGWQDRYIDGKKTKRVQLSHTITDQILWLCNETNCGGGITVKYELICQLKEICWKESRYAYWLELYHLLLLQSLSSSPGFPLHVCCSRQVMRSHETESEGWNY